MAPSAPSTTDGSQVGSCQFSFLRKLNASCHQNMLESEEIGIQIKDAGNNAESYVSGFRRLENESMVLRKQEFANRVVAQDKTPVIALQTIDERKQGALTR
ncbi:uncharacterized protein RSE6_05621 [Rhynchosporium secalis]|uniref:Uncharacterized protein n=1 Tax=Rhynchosporium secalis TaxID=38038 RepID=A0A1E1M8A4_RHYSE|nr:uncharacterized protein RSE6_05621 [Rhynchosporium secalis]